MAQPIPTYPASSTLPLGYFYDTRWSPAPSPTPLPSDALARPDYAPAPQLHSRPSGFRGLTDHLYSRHTDPSKRTYVAIPVSNGYLPARHGTDPSVGNWVSVVSAVRIVFDNNRLRHPAIEGLDYTQHGCILIGRIYWHPSLGPRPDHPPLDRIRLRHFQDPHPASSTAVATYEQLHGHKILDIAGLVRFIPRLPPFIAVPLTALAGVLGIVEIARAGAHFSDSRTLAIWQNQSAQQARFIALLDFEETREAKIREKSALSAIPPTPAKPAVPAAPLPTTPATPPKPIVAATPATPPKTPAPSSLRQRTSPTKPPSKPPTPPTTRGTHGNCCTRIMHWIHSLFVRPRP